LNIIGNRLYNQHIAAPEFGSPAEVVRWLGAVQAQDYAAAKWAVGLRSKTGSDAAVDNALAQGTIIRTHVMRPTWHFVTPADIRWMLELTAPRVNAVLAYNYRRLGLDAAGLKRCNSILVKALQGNKQLTRLELVSILKQRGIQTNNLGFLHILLHAELDGIICSGARRGKQFTYALFDERVPHTARLKRDEALAELTRRYFTSHGPATMQDFAWWSGLTAADAKSGLELVRSQVLNEVVNGVMYWYAGSTPPVKVIPRSAYLLPNFDEYMVGYTDRSAMIEPHHAEKLEDWGVYLLNPAIVMNGKIVGTWKRTLKKESVIIEPRLLTSLNKTQTRALAAAARRYAQFLGMPMELSL
jgi:hypothetical protein